MPQSRQLAAIMFTDIVGYTALMGKDEKNAFEILKKNRQIQQPLVKQYKGTWIKEFGDGVLASFNTVTDAVMCAGAIHQACKEVEGLQLRIGIHLGEVVFENNDVFGDGVNIASRLQALAPIGGTYVSESVYKNVSNKKEIFTEFIREENLKNVSESVRIYEIKLVGSVSFDAEALVILKKENSRKAATRRKRIFAIGTILIFATILSWYFFIYQKGGSVSSNDVPEKSIAVLPFVNMSSDPQQEYFSDGLSEELINMFTRLPDLKVIGRTSSFAFKGKNEDLRSIGKKLGVTYLLEGSVRKSGNLIRITAQLINSETGAHEWSDTYDRELNNIFEIQDQISSSVTNALKVTLLNKNSLQQKNINPEAYNDFLKGRFAYEHTEDSKNNDRAMDWFKEAIKKDSSFSLAWAYLSMCYWRKATNSNQNEFKVAKEAALKALELDPSSGIAAINMAELLDNEFDFHGALEKIELALKLEPEDPYVLRNVGRFYTMIGRKEVSISICKKALEKDPIQSTAFYYLGRAYHFAGKYDEQFKLMEPRTSFPSSKYVESLIMENRLAEARQANENERTRLGVLDRNKPFPYLGTIFLDFKSGKTKDAENKLSLFIETYPDRPFLIATAYGFMNKPDETMRWLEKAYQIKNTELNYVKVDPVFKSLHNDPRFKALIQKMNFPD